MDIVQLLEVLKPAKDVVTVQVASEKEPWTFVTELLKAVLSAAPAAATAVVAWFAMERSNKQFERNAASRAEEFRMTLKQQANTLEIQTRLATEVELKKEICRGVREACTQFLAYANKASNHYVEYKITSKGLKKGAGYTNEDVKNNFNQYMGALQSALSSKMMLMSFLDPREEQFFYDTIIRVDNLLHTNGNGLALGNDVTLDPGADFGYALGECLMECRNYINKRHQEILELTKAISALALD